MQSIGLSNLEGSPLRQFSEKIGDRISEMMRSSEFERAVITFMNTLHLQNADMAILMKEFQTIDKDKDGTLSINEIKNLLPIKLSIEDT